jgi:S-adenosylmethionine:tRNA ribosyltransferase-isomerase
MFLFYKVLRFWQGENGRFMATFDPSDLLTKSYSFDLPEELIAQRPIDSENRSKSRLLIYKKSTNEVIHETFSNVVKYLPANSCLVFNQTKVFSSRLLGHKHSGGKAEIFLLSPLPDSEGTFPCLIKTRSTKKLGMEFILPDELVATIVKINDDATFQVKFDREITDHYLNLYGKIPIPPYIRNGESDEQDKLDYQTIYSKDVGSVAAPTAGLHFTPAVMESLSKNNIDQAYVTLHVGLGTFRPVSADHLKDHQMHYESFKIDAENFVKINNYRPNIVAIGTTSLRVLESMSKYPVIADEFFSTNIFLHPGVEAQSISGLITNFHLPESTLLMLVSSLIGRIKALELYEIAIKERYRFFSYGDAMLILL